MEQLQSSVLFSDSNNQTDRCERAGERERERASESNLTCTQYLGVRKQNAKKVGRDREKD